MKKNVGGLDQKIRYAAGFALVGLGLLKNKKLIIPGIMVSLTAVFQKCTLYDVLGINTYESDN